jgi:hypothetical protein
VLCSYLYFFSQTNNSFFFLLTSLGLISPHQNTKGAFFLSAIREPGKFVFYFTVGNINKGMFFCIVGGTAGSMHVITSELIDSACMDSEVKF